GAGRGVGAEGVLGGGPEGGEGEVAGHSGAAGADIDAAELGQRDREAVGEGDAAAGAEDPDVAALEVRLRTGHFLVDEDRSNLGEGPRVFGEEGIGNRRRSAVEAMSAEEAFIRVCWSGEGSMSRRR